MKKKASLRVLLALTLAVLAAVMTFTVFAAADTNTQDGFVTVDDVLYYYENGNRVVGWFEVD